MTANAWSQERVQQTAEQLDELRQQLARLRDAYQQQQAEVSGLHQTLQTIEGRTLRHEAGEDAARSVQQQLPALTERLEQEATLRRDLTSALGREAEREREQQQDFGHGLDQLAARVAELERQLVAVDERRRSSASELVERGRDERSLAERLAALEHGTASDRETLRSFADALASATAAVAPLTSAVDELETRTQATQRDQLRAGEALAAVRAEREREAELLEVIEQQRATRQRLEERLVAVEAAMQELRNDAAVADEQRAMLRQQTAGAHERLLALTGTLEAQRLAIVEHFRLLAETGAEAGRRQGEEIERANRVARDLAVRLAERSEEATLEQPL